MCIGLWQHICVHCIDTQLFVMPFPLPVRTACCQIHPRIPTEPPRWKSPPEFACLFPSLPALTFHARARPLNPCTECCWPSQPLDHNMNRFHIVPPNAFTRLGHVDGSGRSPQSCQKHWNAQAFGWHVLVWSWGHNHRTCTSWVLKARPFGRNSQNLAI